MRPRIAPDLAPGGLLYMIVDGDGQVVTERAVAGYQHDDDELWREVHAEMRALRRPCYLVIYDGDSGHLLDVCAEHDDGEAVGRRAEVKRIAHAAALGGLE